MEASFPCGHCSRPLILDASGRPPPWCRHCGADVKSAAAHRAPTAAGPIRPTKPGGHGSARPCSRARVEAPPAPMIAAPGAAGIFTPITDRSGATICIAFTSPTSTSSCSSSAPVRYLMASSCRGPRCAITEEEACSARRHVARIAATEPGRPRAGHAGNGRRGDAAPVRPGARRRLRRLPRRRGRGPHRPAVVLGASSGRSRKAC